MTRKDPREAFNDLVRKRQETPVPTEVEDRMRARLHAFRADLQFRDRHPLLPKAPSFGSRRESSLDWKTLLTAAVIAGALIAAVVVLTGG